jgi:hypothetical protein
MRRFSWLALSITVALPGCPESRGGDGDSGPPADAEADSDGGGDMDAGARADSGRDARADEPDAPVGCGPECPPEFCIDGVCRVPGGCCRGEPCADGERCDFRSCTCSVPSGCCAGETCAAGEICDFDSCTCATEGDCCRLGECPFGEICMGDCTCGVDTSCGPECSGDRVCMFGECYHRCIFEGCPDPTFVCSTVEGCIPPRCTRMDCAFSEPPHDCDPAVGCHDPCLDSDFSWCFARGGRCVLGQCIEDSCAAVTVGCHYRYDCCGNTVCLRDDQPDPTCLPCPPEPNIAPRPDLCGCSIDGYCVDLWGGGVRPPFPGPVPPPR